MLRDRAPESPWIFIYDIRKGPHVPGLKERWLGIFFSVRRYLGWEIWPGVGSERGLARRVAHSLLAVPAEDLSPSLTASTSELADWKGDAGRGAQKAPAPHEPLAGRRVEHGTAGRGLPIRVGSPSRSPSCRIEMYEKVIGFIIASVFSLSCSQAVTAGSARCDSDAGGVTPAAAFDAVTCDHEDPLDSVRLLRRFRLRWCYESPSLLQLLCRPF